MSEFNSYIKNKLVEFNERFHTNEEYILYEGLYKDIEDRNLGELFARMHSALNKLLKFLNEKHNGFSGGHYNASESRQLIWYIDFYRMLKVNLLKLNIEMKIIEEYEKRFEELSGFLSASGGSAIPVEFAKIQLVESQSIFNLGDQIKVLADKQTMTKSLKCIGEGSYAKVFKYKEPNTNQWIVIKKAKNNLTEDELIRFKLEFESIKKLNSPFIVTAYKYSDEENSYTMEFIDEVLETYISTRNTRLPFNKRKVLIVQLLNAFGYLHSKDMLHRDISYKNILVKTYDDGTDMLKITDLGLVKIKNSELTKENTLIKGSINDLTDLERVGFKNYSIYHETYALTKVVYFILTGKKSNYEREKDESLKKFLEKGLNPQRENRFKSVDEMKEFIGSKIYSSIKNK